LNIPKINVLFDSVVLQKSHKFDFIKPYLKYFIIWYKMPKIYSIMFYQYLVLSKSASSEDYLSIKKTNL